MARFRWGLLLLVFASPALITGLIQDIGATAWDAAMEHIYRGAVFSQAISEGIFFPRWTQFLHLGLGSPLFTFQPLLPYYGLDVLFRLGMPHHLGWRVLVTSGLLAACLGAYLLAYAVTGRKWAAVVAGTAYLYAPYVIRNSLERGSNEMFSMFVYPWVLVTLLWLAQQPSIWRLIGATAAWAVCIGSHVLGPLMLAPVAGLLALCLARKYRTVTPLLALVAGGLLTAWIWMPMASEQGWVHVERDFATPDAMPAQNPIAVESLLTPPGLFDVAGGNNGTGNYVGLANSLLLLAGIPAAAYGWATKREKLALVLAAVVAVGVILFWLLTPASDAAWRLGAPVLGRLLYRSRLMGLQALAVATVAGVSLALLPASWQRGLGLALSVLFVLLALPSLYVGLLPRRAEFAGNVSLGQVRAAEEASGGRALTAFGEFTPRWHDGLFERSFTDLIGGVRDPRSAPLVNPPDSVTLEDTRISSNSWELRVAAEEPVTLTLYLLFYPRWQATVDGVPVALQPQTATGLAQLHLQDGKHRIALRYGSTPAETLGIVISVLTLSGMLAAAVRGLAGRQGPRPKRVDGGTVETPPSMPQLLVLAFLVAFKFLYVDTSTTWLRCVSMADSICGAETTVDVPFVGGPRLRGYTLSSSTAAPGSRYRLDLYWQTDQANLPSLHSFVHVRNSQPDWPANPKTNGDGWAQSDHVTVGGLLSTDQLLPDKIYRDEFEVSLPADQPAGTYYLEIGWYSPVTNEQLDPFPEKVKPPLRILWRSILLPSLRVR